MQEAIDNNATPRQLRRLFILLVVGGKPVAAAFDTYHTHMIEPAWIENHPRETARLLKLLQCLQRHLLAEGCKGVQHLGINVPEGFVLEDYELQRARVAQLLDHREKDVDTVLRALAMFTDEQRVVFDTIVNACQSDEDYTFDIRGRAGTGKTVLMNAISAQVRLNNHLTAPAASTGLASLNQPFGLTFHRTWSIPVPDPRDDCVVNSKLDTSPRLHLMTEVRLATLDEAPSLHVASYEAACRFSSCNVNNNASSVSQSATIHPFNNACNIELEAGPTYEG